MVKGRKLALIAAGIGVFAFSAFEPSFIPVMWASTSRLADARTDWRAELSNDVDDIDTVDIWEHDTPVSVKPPHDRIAPSKNEEALAALGAMWLDAERDADDDDIWKHYTPVMPPRHRIPSKTSEIQEVRERLRARLMRGQTVKNIEAVTFATA